MPTLNPTFYGSVIEGKFTFDAPDDFKSYIRTLKGQIQVTVEKRKKNRTSKENRYYWGVVIPILADHFGYEGEEMHEALKWQFLRKPHSKLPTVQSTAAMSTIEFEEYMRKIRTWAAMEYSISIPEPNENLTYSYD